jgi:hypothetical protein
VKSGVASETPAFITTCPPPRCHSSTKLPARTDGASASLTKSTAALRWGRLARAHLAAGRERDTVWPLIGKAIGDRNHAPSPPSPPMAGTPCSSSNGTPAENVNGAMLPMNACTSSSRIRRRMAVACLPGSAASSTWMTFTGRPWMPPLALTHRSHTVRPRNPFSSAAPTRPERVPTAPSTIGGPDAARTPPVVPPLVVPPAPEPVVPPVPEPVVPPVVLSIAGPVPPSVAVTVPLPLPDTMRSTSDVAVVELSSVTRVPQAATIVHRATTTKTARLFI